MPSAPAASAVALPWWSVRTTFAPGAAGSFTETGAEAGSPFREPTTASAEPSGFSKTTTRAPGSA